MFSQRELALERFTSATKNPAQTPSALNAASAAASRLMSIQFDGCKSTIPFNATLGNILDSVRAAGLPAPYACKAGVCATCRAKLLSGQVTMNQNYGLTPRNSPRATS